MDKQKQIEEMASCLIGKAVTGADSTKVLNLGYITVKEIASILINAGYRKPTKGEVVLTKEEKEEYESLVKLLIYDKPVHSRVYEVVKDIKENARKETVEKFAERLKEKLEENVPFVGYDLEDCEFDGETIQECINEICKELTEGK